MVNSKDTKTQLKYPTAVTSLEPEKLNVQAYVQTPQCQCRYQRTITFKLKAGNLLQKLSSIICR